MPSRIFGAYISSGCSAWFSLPFRALWYGSAPRVNIDQNAALIVAVNGEVKPQVNGGNFRELSERAVNAPCCADLCGLFSGLCRRLCVPVPLRLQSSQTETEQPASFTDLNGGAEYFGLRVCGDSMNALRINDGDIIIVRRQEEVEQGEVAMALVDGEDATVKHFYFSNTTVTLMPQSTNPEHKPQMYDFSKTAIRVLDRVVEVNFLI